MLTQANKTALKADIEANPAAAPFLNTNQYGEIAKLYNVVASPDFVVWRNNISIDEVGKAITYTAIASMTTGNQTRLQVFENYNRAGFNANVDIDAMFQDVFSGALGGGGAPSRAAIEAVLRRLATLAEKVCASGNGTTVDPGLMTYEGNLSAFDVERIMVEG